ncbi:hypothetical protein DPMN_189342, partial [Dreissena polymorpha]
IYMLHANGKPAIRERFSLTIDGSSPEQHRTNKDGYYLAHIHAVNQNLERRKIKVYAPAFENCATEIVLQPYTGVSQIVVEKVEREGASFIQAYTDINMNQVAQCSGILMLITARGKIVKTKYFPPSKDVSFKLETDVVNKVSPVGRVFAFYVHNAQLVADSSIFHVDSKCREQLELHPEKLEVRAGRVSKLTVTGPSGMWVGFNVIDKALLLFNNKNVLRENTLFRNMAAHDLGCGAGGGTNSEEIFKNAGLTILTNANVNEERIQRETAECAAKKLKRRAVSDENGLYFGSKPLCCEEGRQYSSDVISDYEMEKRHFKREVSEPVPERGSYVASDGSVFSFQDRYHMDIGLLEDMGLQMGIRKRFETWFFFEEHMISDNGLTLAMKYRDSITEWSIQAIGISEHYGACIAAPKEVKAFKDYFIQVDLPYKVLQKEMFNVKVTVFNFIPQELSARVYMKGVSSFCNGTSPGQHSQPQPLTLPPNGARTLTFPMIPLKAGTYPITVSAFVTNRHLPFADIVEKQLLVMNEGILEKKSFTVCLDPNFQMENCIQGPEVKRTVQLNVDNSPSVKMEVELPLPPSSLPGTAIVNAYIQSNLMGDPVLCVLVGVDKMFNEPRGSGENIMQYTAPIVYGMYFLKQTGTMEAKHEESGYRYMRNGITRQQYMYQKDDGSYAAWKERPSSLWLTAFVAKVFCQAEHLVRGMSDLNSLQKTLAYISKNNLEGSGDFRDDSPVVHKEMQGVFGQGDTRSGPSLTAFVLISLQECTERTVV